jgi:DNA repair exonuclease SbcCD ATPase subunit
MSGGITEKLRGSLESYLERSAAELDERGAALAELASEFEAQRVMLEQAEAQLAQRRRRIEELTPIQRELDRAFDRTLADLAARSAHVAAQLSALEQRLKRVAQSEAELAQRERSFTERSDRIRIDQRRLAERERALSALREGPTPADRDALDTRARALDEREQEIQTRRLHADVELRARKEDLERRERALDRREAELRAYVAQLQQLQRNPGF